MQLFEAPLPGMPPDVAFLWGHLIGAVRECKGQNYDKVQASLDTNLIDAFDLDSLEQVEVTMMLEERLETDIAEPANEESFISGTAAEVIQRVIDASVVTQPQPKDFSPCDTLDL